MHSTLHVCQGYIQIFLRWGEGGFKDWKDASKFVHMNFRHVFTSQEKKFKMFKLSNSSLDSVLMLVQV